MSPCLHLPGFHFGYILLTTAISLVMLGVGDVTQLFSGTNCFPFFLVAAPLKMVFSRKGPLFFARVTEQLRLGGAHLLGHPLYPVNDRRVTESLHPLKHVACGCCPAGLDQKRPYRFWWCFQAEQVWQLAVMALLQLFWCDFMSIVFLSRKLV